jgi:hypothetical protein
MLFKRLQIGSTLPPQHPARRWFAGMVEQVFEAEIGVCSPRLTDYLGGLLVELIHSDDIYRYSREDGAAIRDLSELVANVEYAEDGADSRHKREVHRYIGDFTLFWTGVYPEQLRPRLAGVDRLSEYMLRGKQSYSIAGELTRRDEHPQADVLRELSAQFECCVEGLHRVREAWERETGLHGA